MTITSNPSPVFTPTPDKFEINNAVIYPNPYHPAAGVGAYLHCDITQDALNIKIKIYTTGFRAVKEITVPGIIKAGRVDAHVEERDISNLAGGIYYYTVKAENGQGVKAKAPPGVLVIIR
jgi:hypothetical protein